MHNPKGWLSIKRFPVLCAGLINHSWKYKQFTWFLPTIKQDPNLVITMLWLNLVEGYTSGKRRAPILYLQADNCGKENKNVYVFYFLAVLIYHKIFLDVYMSFLPVGHTHEDIDRMFSFPRNAFSGSNCDTLDDLIRFIVPSAFHVVDKPVNRLHPNLFNWKDWMRPYLPDLRGHSGPKLFHFFKSEESNRVSKFL